MMYDAVAESDGHLQIIAFDHADFSTHGSRESIIEPWYDGAALIPSDWYAAEPSMPPTLPEAGPAAADDA